MTEFGANWLMESAIRKVSVSTRKEVIKFHTWLYNEELR